MMTIRLKAAFWIAGVPAFFLASSAADAQQCSASTTTGKYFSVCDGYVTPAANAPLVPAKILGTLIIDSSGQTTGTTTASIGGQIFLETLKGKQNVNADCTGTGTYAQTVNNQPGPPLDVAFFVSEFGNRIDEIVTDAGSVVSCVLRRTSVSIYAASPAEPAPDTADPIVASVRKPLQTTAAGTQEPEQFGNNRLRAASSTK